MTTLFKVRPCWRRRNKDRTSVECLQCWQVAGSPMVAAIQKLHDCSATFQKGMKIRCLDHSMIIHLDAF